MNILRPCSKPAGKLFAQFPHGNAGGMFAKIFGNQPIGLGYKISRLVTELADGLRTPQDRPMAAHNRLRARIFDRLDGLKVGIHVKVRRTQFPTSIEAHVSRSLDGVPVKQSAVLSIVASQMPVAVAWQVPDFKNSVFAQS